MVSELQFRTKFFLGLLVLGYLITRLIVYLTGVLAHYFMYNVWKFF
jgi:hypothetical protein